MPKRPPTDGGPIVVSQMDLVLAISRHLTDRYGNFPMIPRQFNAIVAAADSIVEAFATGRILCKPGDGVNAWMVSDDTGKSSLCMARRLKNRPQWDMAAATPDDRDAYPRDPDDFGRCVRLLEVAPELRPWLHEMKDCGPVWARLVGAWDELESLYRAELPAGKAPRLYERMKELIESKGTP